MAVPAVTPVTTPVEVFTVALPLLLLHVPLAGVEFKLVVNPTHTTGLPVIVVGLALTLTVVDVEPVNPLPSVTVNV